MVQHLVLVNLALHHDLLLKCMHRAFELATTDCAVAGTLTGKAHVEIHGVDAPNLEFSPFC